jgi:hypothetical protein
MRESLSRSSSLGASAVQFAQALLRAPCVVEQAQTPQSLKSPPGPDRSGRHAVHTPQAAIADSVARGFWAAARHKADGGQQGPAGWGVWAARALSPTTL